MRRDGTAGRSTMVPWRADPSMPNRQGRHHKRLCAAFISSASSSTSAELKQYLTHVQPLHHRAASNKKCYLLKHNVWSLIFPGYRPNLLVDKIGLSRYLDEQPVP